MIVWGQALFTGSSDGHHFNAFFFSCWVCLLLCSVRSKHSLRVREHKVLGPYVDGLSKLAVSSFHVRFGFL